MAKRNTPKTTSSKTAKKNLSKRRFFSFWKVLTFVVVFAAIGAFMIYKSFAAYNYYTIDPKIAWWQNDLRRQYGSSPQFLPLNDCVSGYARNWAYKMATRYGLVHSGNVINWGAEIQKCGNWRWMGENIWKGRCANPIVGDVLKAANDCSWSVVDGPVSFLHDGRNPNTHLANVLHNGTTVQGVGSYYRYDTGEMWVAVEYVRF